MSQLNQPLALDCSLHDPNLYDTRDGRILRCNCCGRIQIEFRRHTLLIDAEKLETLLGAVVDVLDEMERGETSSWRLSAPTDAGTVSATFNAEELQALYELLAGGQSETTSSAEIWGSPRSGRSLKLLPRRRSGDLLARGAGRPHAD